MPADEPGSMRFRAAVLVAGLVLPQLWLHGSSLVGWTVPYPCDLLALPNVYLPRSEYPDVTPRDHVLRDLLDFTYFERKFAAEEFRAGRLPLWNPWTYLGAPSVHHSKYAPYELLYLLWPTHRMLVLLFFLQALVTGTGAYRVFRQLCEASFWPAAVCAWIFPLSGYFIAWQGYPMPQAVSFFPWMLLATDAAVRNPRGRGGPALAGLTAACMLSRFDAAGQCLLVSGLYALFVWWQLSGAYLRRAVRDRARYLNRQSFTRLMAPAAGWGLGLALCLPYLMPLAEFAATGARVVDRSAGVEERPPVGWQAIPQFLVPHVYGCTRHDSFRCIPGNLHESAAMAHAGLIVILLAMPLAWANRDKRPLLQFLAVLAVLGMAWQMNLYGVVLLLRMPVLNLLPHNRFGFVTAFCLLAMASIGFDQLQQGRVPRRGVALLALFMSLLLGGWCLWRAIELPWELQDAMLKWRLGRLTGYTAERMQAIQANFFQCGLWAAARCGVIALTWLLLISGRRCSRGWIGLLMVLALTENFVLARYDDRHAPARLDFPRIPALEAMKQLPSGRFIGGNCLYPNLGMSLPMKDVRGYDAIDTLPVVRLIELISDPGYASPGYARTQSVVPAVAPAAGGGVQFPPALDMLGVRYYISRLRPRADLKPVAQSPEYWILSNARALPRAWVPRSVEVQPSVAAVLKALRDDQFDARETAYVDRPTSEPIAPGARGEVTLIIDEPRRVVLESQTDAPALVVLSDLFDPGWSATVDGRSAEIVRVNTALRGLRVPVGRHVIDYRYWPHSLTRGLIAAALSAGTLGLWIVLSARRSESRSNVGEAQRSA